MKRLLVTGCLLVPASSLAHIHLTYPTSRTDMPTGEQKDEHCGLTGYSRAAHPERVSTFAPGATITVTWAETINHPGWYRIAFQPNGEIFGIPPAGNGPAGNGGAASNFPDQPQVGLDAVNGSIVLVDRIADGMLSQQITFPDMECTNCTLQFIQVMTDKPPYTVDAGSDDIYFNCADITLSANAPDAGPQAGPDAGPGGTGDAGTGGETSVSGGCSTGSGAAGWGVGLAIGLALTRRRRR